MNFAQSHLDIARERFLELMAANPSSDPRDTAIAAIGQADTFIGTYKAIVDFEVSAPRKMKGCKACYGSGGKPIDPCKVCHGTGKVEAA